MELYFDKPSLVRAFYFKDARDFTCYHWHDEDLALRRQNVLYLYRHPVATIYSQLNYYKENLDDTERIRYWAELYGRHLKKWLVTDDFTTKKTVLTYEGLKADLVGEFEKICRHLDAQFDSQRILQVSAQVTKTTLKEKTQHDAQVVNLSDAYAERRGRFEQQHSRLVMETVLSQEEQLGGLFQQSP